jgi:hypothetical protein
MAIALLAAVAALGLLLIVLLLAVWRRSLRREQRLEEDIREVRDRLGVIGDAWSASATRLPGFPTRPGPNDDPPDEEDEQDDEDDDDDDPFNLFGGRDPLDRDPDDDEDDDDQDRFADDDDPPPGFR